MSSSSSGGQVEEKDVPCCMYLLVFGKVLVDWVLCLYAMPLWLLLVFTREIVVNQNYPLNTIKNHSLHLYLYIAWIPRFLISTLFFTVCSFLLLSSV